MPDKSSSYKVEYDTNEVVLRNFRNHKKKQEKNGNMETKKKHDNSKSLEMKKLNESNEAGEITKINTKVYQAIIKSRNAKGWKRKELAKKISVKTQVIESIETGKEKYDIKLIQKLERKLGIKLTGEAFK
tara:strand:- start:1297 stop:1686 length:390 start_codon:yes stop_codon:yes gene_type:complete